MVWDTRIQSSYIACDPPIIEVYPEVAWYLSDNLANPQSKAIIGNLPIHPIVHLMNLYQQQSVGLLEDWYPYGP